MTDTAQKSKAISVYALFGVTIVLTLIPVMAAGFSSLILAITLIIVTYKMRGEKDAAHKTLDESHASYILRSIAGVSILMTITLGLGIVYLLGNIDYAAFEPCAQNLASLGTDPADISNAAVMQLAAPCIDGFIAANKAVLIKSMLITALLPLLYIGWRFVYGVSRALKKQRIDNPYKWI